MTVTKGALAGPIVAIVLAWACTPTPSEVMIDSLDSGGSDSTSTGGPSTVDGSTGEDTGPPVGSVCGDGVIEGEETCDLGPDNGTGDYCRADCQSNVCGDGYHGPGEACDDGNTNNEDDCTNSCGLASCGDNVVQPGEECDEGAGNSDTGACLPSCIAASCGDQHIQAGV
ncbi:MAG: hypothetical protein KC501_42250, partial [Myxococcales bacterium]|nr:hypothetical protein [Myxococcales bacterium]